LNENGIQRIFKDSNSMEIERIYVLGELQGQGSLERWILDAGHFPKQGSKNKYDLWLGVGTQ